MSVSYDKLFHVMIYRKISDAQLMAMCGFSANIIARLKHSEYISMESLGKICCALICTPNDVFEFVPEEGEIDVK